MIYLQQAESAKKAFLFIKEKAEAWSFHNNEANQLEPYKRYQIIDTVVRSAIDAQLHYQNYLATQDLNLRPKTLGCLICEDSYYLFFEPYTP